MNWKLLGVVVAGSGALGLSYSQPGATAGFAVLEQSAKRMGTAYAGGGAVADEAASVWYNPAASTRLGRDMQLGLHYIDPSFEFDDPVAVGSVAPSPLLLSSRQEDVDGGTTAVLPNFAYSALVSGDWYAGFTVNVPFGLATEYEADWVGRYKALDSEITSINVNPFVAYRFNEAWALGLGYNLNYTEVSLSRAIDFAGVCAQIVGGVCPNGATPGAGEFDGHVEAEGDDVASGYNLGLLWSPDYRTRVSLAYRSEIDLDLTGDGKFRHPTTLGGFAALGPELGAGLEAAFADSDVEAGLSLPDTLSLSLYQLLTLRTALLADITWTGWSSVPAINVAFDNPLTPATEERLEWDDTVRYSLGLSFKPDESWTLRTGLAYDESPVPNARLRSPRLPDNDRTWFALGASKVLSRTVSMDVSYSHVLIEDTDIEWETLGGDFIRGEYESEGNNVSLAINFNF